MAGQVQIRTAEAGDLAAILEIYNHEVLTGVATFDMEPRTVAVQEQWFSEHGPQYPAIVACENGQVVGWATLSRYSPRRAYARTAEASLYVHKDARGRGIGRALFAAMLAAGRAAGLHTVVSRIVGGNDISVRLHEQAGFAHVGVMREVGYKFGRWLDVVTMQLILD